MRYELHEIERIISEGEGLTEIRKAQLQVLEAKLKVEVERIQKTLVHLSSPLVSSVFKWVYFTS